MRNSISDEKKVQARTGGRMRTAEGERHAEGENKK